MAKDIDLNCDMGESYGRWTLGADEEIMPWITSANVACGFHGGDPHVMRRTVALALKHTVAIGSHPSLPDLMGFGRRVMDVTPQEVKDYLCYQTGALREFVRAAGGDLQHLKPHGILYNMMEKEEALAVAAGEAVLESGGQGLVLMPLASGKHDAACRKMTGWGLGHRAEPDGPGRGGHRLPARAAGSPSPDARPAPRPRQQPDPLVGTRRPRVAQGGLGHPARGPPRPRCVARSQAGRDGRV